MRTIRIHKHLVRHTKRYISHFTKYLYERDTVFSLLTVFLFIFLVKFLPLNLHFLDPMKLALKDFDFNDIAYAKLGKGDTTRLDQRIVIVNIGQIDRAQMGFLIEKTAAMKPAVIGLDVYFEGPKDADKDSILRAAFKKTKNLVVISRIKADPHHHAEKLELQKDYFDPDVSTRGYANVIGEEGGTIRYYSPFEKIEEEKYPSFTSALIKQYDKKVYETLEKRHKPVEIINYTRRVNQKENQYIVVECDQVMMDLTDSSMFKNKIVLLGYVNLDKNNIEDKMFTPMNESFAGKSTPDMNGIVVHANILSMILDKNFIKKMPVWVAWLVAILIGWLHMSLFIRFYLEDHIWFHLIAKIAQIISAVFFVYLGLFLFDRYRIKLDMELTLVVIILSVDIIYFYEAFATWMNKKFKYATIFTHHHHPVEQDELKEPGQHH